jgi:hypothetical protein
VAIVCPYCGNSMAIPSASPGRYRPRCVKCQRPFVIDVPANPGDTLAVAAAPAEPAKAVPAAAVPVTAAPVATPLPETLGGYQLLKELGRGGMGAVYLARQLSLDRKVALKVMKPQLAGNPSFMARFTREAHAAAQLVHHNIVAIYDVGSDRGFHYFSMEYVEGPSLGDLVRRQGPLPAEVAVGYVLQAARGLKYGHDRGMVHRDVKPDNLLLNDQGIVKVADLGLVKTLGAAEAAGPPVALPAGPVGDLTLAHTAVGTPNYMAPEQARDSTRVDARADVYSLGCTLYFLVTGRPPFGGGTALEVLTRHAFEPIVPPDALVQGLPKALSDVVLKMVAKKPQERYADMGEVIRVLEGFLGVQGAGAFVPREEHADLLAQAVRRFHEVPAAQQRTWLLLGFFGTCGLLLAVCLLLRAWGLVFGVVSLAVLAPLAYALVRGGSRRTYLYLRARELVLGARRTDWLIGLAGAGVFLGVLALFSWLGLWVGCAVLAVTLATTFYLIVDRQVAEERRGSVQEVEELLRSLRLRGFDEESLRQFVCQYGGDGWEAFYEALFGYEALREARLRWGHVGGKPRPRHAAWRDPVADWIEARLHARHEARERQVLASAEQQDLEAQGVPPAEAGARAEQAAEAIVAQAAQPPVPPDTYAVVGDEGRPRPRKPLLWPRPGPGPKPEALRRREQYYVRELWFDRLLGPRMRFLVGLVLLAGCAGWMHQNDLIPGQQLKQVAGEAVDRGDVPDVTPLRNYDWNRATKPLNLPPLPALLTEGFASFNPGAAGLLLVLSALLRGTRIALCGWLAAVVTCVGPSVGVPALGPLTPHQVSMAAGAVLVVAGFVPLR